MQWTDEGIVLGSKRHGEANAILELMTRAHGRHLGLVRGGAGTRMRPVLQPGNVRSEEHTSELQSQSNLVCRLLLEKKKKRCQTSYAVISNALTTPIHVCV